ncbi:hypothetical protein AB0J83_01690 [Actinoplanes sp. NPDC049596]|uniref:hypothetical protein n=1 Tax=unclassified Actinoplanes TaxID=2626549 RepID=UPI00343AE815
MKLGLRAWVIVVLGLLAAPRAVLHDLDLVQERTGINAALVFLPLLVWLVVAVRWSSNPFLSLLTAGGVYGVALGVIHNVLWDGEARLALLLRGAMTVSSLFTGLAVGAICGAAAWLLRRGLARLH